MLTDDEITAMSPDERRDMIARLVDASRLPQLTHGAPRYRSVFLRVLLIATLLLIPWIFFLASKLPREYTAHNWDVVWALFDVALLVALGVTAWGVWKRRQIVIITSVISGTLLLCDAWFDIMTSHPGRDQTMSMLAALLGEVPMAALMFYTAFRLIRMSARTVDLLLGGTGEVGSIWRQPLLMVQARRFLQNHGQAGNDH